MHMQFYEKLETGRCIGLYSGLQIQWGSVTGAQEDIAMGQTRWRGGCEIDGETLFDIASLTKVVCTSLLCMYAVAEGRLCLEQSLSHYWPELKSWGDDFNLAQLLAHQTPLAAWHNFAAQIPQEQWGEPQARTAMKALCLQYPLRRKDSGELQASTEYTDLGFMLLGFLLENALGDSLDALFMRHVAQPLGLENTCFRPQVLERCACTKWVKGLPLQAVPDDDNARALGGVSGHAGLFSCARDLGVLCRALLTEDARLPYLAKLLESFWDYTPQASRFALAWDRATGEQSLSGMPQSTNVIGHLGFTGCSLWLHRQTRRYWILLCNRTHGVFPPDRLAGIRRELGQIANSEA